MNKRNEFFIRNIFHSLCDWPHHDFGGDFFGFVPTTFIKIHPPNPLANTLYLFYPNENKILDCAFNIFIRIIVSIRFVIV